MKVNLDQLEVILSKFGFRHFRTIFLSDDSMVIEFKTCYLNESEIRELRILGFSRIKHYSDFYVVAVKFDSHD